MDVRRIARMVGACEADAWVVIGGSREVLEWFAARETPVIALFGRRRGVPVASVGPDKPPVLAAVTRELIGLGHRRIVRWVANVSRGKEDLRRTLTPTEFVPGGTIGPVGRGLRA